MTKATITVETTTYVHCPSCNAKAWPIDHVLADKALLDTLCWSCPYCGVACELHIKSPTEVEIVINSNMSISVPCLHLLKMRPQDHPVFFVIRSFDYYRGHDGQAPFANAKYYYEEGTCPVNWIADIEMIAAGNNTDPHGLFEYVTSVDLPFNAPDDVDEIIIRDLGPSMELTE